ncbi:MAG: UvrB/UvrC motif-containing protein [Gemmatimonadetes bacterium]|nr:UvrB/UvrC motif-containing protein [Gemmatimonadota bacterium]
MARLEAVLAAAVAAERFEEAAELRDRLRQLREAAQ